MSSFITDGLWSSIKDAKKEILAALLLGISFFLVFIGVLLGASTLAYLAGGWIASLLTASVVLLATALGLLLFVRKSPALKTEENRAESPADHDEPVSIAAAYEDPEPAPSRRSSSDAIAAALALFLGAGAAVGPGRMVRIVARLISIWMTVESMSKKESGRTSV